MRVGVSSRGRWWVSMGPVGWLIVGPFILAFYAVIGVVWLIIFLVKAIVALAETISESRQERRISRQATSSGWPVDPPPYPGERLTVVKPPPNPEFVVGDPPQGYGYYQR